MQDRDRCANMLGALSAAVVEQVKTALLSHPNHNDSSLAALKLVGEFEGCSNSQLSQALGLSHTATVRLTDKLVASGLVDRAPAADRRAVSLSLTSEGRMRVDDALQTRMTVLRDLVADLDEGVVGSLGDALTVMLRALTTTPLAGAHICRLCREQSCPQCPVHEAVRTDG